MKKREKGTFTPRKIDRIVFAILSTLFLFGGLYVVGPWYLESTKKGESPLIRLLSNELAVGGYGYAIMLVGLLLVYAAVGKSTHQFYTPIVSFALLAGFLLRLYSLFGVVMTLESWRPPGYLSHTATVLILGAYWVWVRVSERTIQ